MTTISETLSSDSCVIPSVSLPFQFIIPMVTFSYVLQPSHTKEWPSWGWDLISAAVVLWLSPNICDAPFLKSLPWNSLLLISLFPLSLCIILRSGSDIMSWISKPQTHQSKYTTLFSKPLSECHASWYVLHSFPRCIILLPIPDFRSWMSKSHTFHKSCATLHSRKLWQS